MRILPVLFLSFAVSSYTPAAQRTAPAEGPSAKVVTTGIPINPAYSAANAVTDGFHLFGTANESQASADLNGDGDTGDDVLQHVDLRSAQRINLGLATPFQLQVAAKDGRVLFAVTESGQRLDLNGDGDQNDVVPHVYDPSTASVHSSGLAAWAGWHATGLNGEEVWLTNGSTRYEWNPGVALPRDLGLDWAGAHNGTFFWGVQSEEAATDLNGDGDSGDSVWHVYDARTGEITNLGLARAGLASGFAHGWAVLVVSEFHQGSIDLNGDGDALDGVYFAFDAEENELVPLGLASGQLCSPYACNDPVSEIGAARAFFVVDEAAQGSDLDGDGALSLVPFLYDRGELAAELMTRPEPIDPEARFFAIVVPEAPLDRNGDGDTSDRVLTIRRLVDATEFQTGLACGGTLSPMVNDWILARVYEYGQGSDLNGDGDLGDYVVHACHAATGEIRNLGLVIGFGAPFHAAGHRLLFTASRDGAPYPSADSAFFFDTRWETLVDTRARGWIPYNSSSSTRSSLVLTSEASEGQDLTGDGDLADKVLRGLLFDRRYR